MHIKSRHLRTTWRRFIACVAIGVFLGLVVTSAAPSPAASQASTPITGWAWTDTVGWISLNCIDGGTGGANICSTRNYGLSVDPSTYVVDGYAWSDNIGWVSARAADIASCAASATSKLENDAWTGWLRAIEGGSAQSGGWDGCISMSGAGYGVTVNSVTGFFNPCAVGSTSCAWEGNTDPGAAVVGWVDFSYGKYQCTPPQVGNFCEASSTCRYDTSCTKQCFLCDYGCNAGDGQCNPPPLTNCTIEVHPILVGANNVGATVSWNVSNVKNDPASFGGSNVACAVTGTNSDGTPAPQTGWSTAADASDNAIGSNTSSILTAPVTFTVTCMGVDNQLHSCSAEAEYAPSFREE